jgi:hypothetical protein
LNLTGDASVSTIIALSENKLTVVEQEEL